MKKMSILTGILLSSALVLTVGACKGKGNSSSPSSTEPEPPTLEAVQVDPYTLSANYRNLRINGMGYSGEQFTEHSKEVEEDGKTVTKKTYVVEDVKALVIPVDFTDAPYSWYGDSEEETREVLNDVFFGGPEDMQWYSLKEYYKSTSFGQCNISGSVGPWWHTNISYKSLPTGTDGKTSTAYSKTLAIQIQDYYRAHSNEINLADYDANRDGLVDSLIMIYTAPIDTTGSLWWAFCWSVGGAWGKYTPSGNLEGVNRFFWASYRFLFERNNPQAGEPEQYTSDEIKAGVDMHGNPIYPDAHTMTHEYGHVLSLPDYYITDYDSSDYGAMGGLDMMDYNVGDHNAYSKMMYGWINPRRIEGTEGSVTVTLNSTTKTGDTLIIPAPGEWNNTYLDQYLVIEFLTPEGVARQDGLAPYLGHYPQYYSNAGIRILHIDSRMGVFQQSGDDYAFVGYTWTTKTDLSKAYVGVAADNTKSRSCFPKYKLAEVLPADGKSIKAHNGRASNDCLYYEGQGFGENGVWENFKLNGLTGEKDKDFGFVIHVDKIDGNKSATLTISR